MAEDLKSQVQSVLDKEIRPNLQNDGGDAELVAVSADGVVQVRLTGHCSGCPFSAMTLAFGVEKTLKERIPQITRVEAVA
jgi:Fe-S cluster biogenesis protein NfuA